MAAGLLPVRLARALTGSKVTTKIIHRTNLASSTPKISITTDLSSSWSNRTKQSRYSSGSTTQEYKDAKLLDMASGPVNAFQMNQYVIACTETKQAALVDCGASTQQELDAFLGWISEKDYTLSAVFQTHAHLDHVAGLGLLMQTDTTKTDDVPIYLHELEREIYHSFEARRKDFGFAVEGDGILPEDGRITYFDHTTTPSLTLGNLELEIFFCPGHSPGQCGFYEPKSKAFLGGDFIMTGSIGRTDFPTSSPNDMDASLKRFLEFMDSKLKGTDGDDADSDIMIYPGHGGPTSLKREKASNPFLRKFIK